ncbi:MAG: hypothetical protein JO254_01780 [Pseudolabrys sp.]|nr:hypothetical protein [Pseudolabrys sp.]
MRAFCVSTALVDALRTLGANRIVLAARVLAAFIRGPIFRTFDDDVLGERSASQPFKREGVGRDLAE